MESSAAAISNDADRGIEGCGALLLLLVLPKSRPGVAAGPNTGDEPKSAAAAADAVSKKLLPLLLLRGRLLVAEPAPAALAVPADGALAEVSEAKPSSIICHSLSS